MAPGTGARDKGSALAQACAALKVFPLPGVVVLPGAPTPLHVFEPRYRALVEDALAGDRILAIPTLVRDEDAMEARAAVHPICGAAIIEAEERHADGKLDILLRGIGRVRLHEELEGEPYRRFRAEVLPDVFPAGGPAALAADTGAVVRLVYELAGHLPPESGAPQLVETVTHLRHDPAAVADLVAAATVSEHDARLAVIAETSVARRLALVKEELASVVLLLSRGKNPTV